ncbi:MAG: hypothetical protein GYA87_08095, partial [Christensenellaceae bacterium]|nr:hypothetical protein [Christensenellaceae bacterium]
PYTYAWYLYKDGVRIATTPYTLSNVYKYTITTIGEYYVVGFVKDKCGNAAFKATNKFIATSVPLSINSVNASATTVPRNMPITWTTIAVGGKAPLTYSYHLYYNGNRIVTTPYSTNKTYTYTPYATGNYHVEVFVKDDAGQSDSMISAATAVTNTSNLKVSVSYAPLNPSIGTTITATIAASDGITPYKYAFYVYRNGAKVLTTNYSTNNKLTYKIPQSGTYYVVGFAKDAYNTTKFAKTANIIVNVVPLSFDLNINKTATTVNDTVTASITNVKGGVAPYQYAFYVYNGTTKVYTRAYNTNASLVYKFTSAGVYKIMAFVRDDVGTIVHKTSANINVINPDTQPLQLVITAAAPNVPVGQIMRWNVKAWGGAAPYSFTYVLYKKAADSTLTKIKTTTSTNNYFEYMPTITGDYVVEVTVKDVKNRTNTLMSPVINVTAIPNLSVSIKHDAGATINIGNKITWSAFNSTGGKPPYTFAFYVHRNGTRVASTGYSKNYTYSYTPMQTGTYNATVFIKDSLNTIKYTTSTDITVTNPPTVPVQIDNLTANITSGKVGAKMIWDLKASGGTKPYRYAYYLYLDGKKIEERPYSTYAGFSHVAAVPGKYTVTGFVKDANGSTAHKTSAIITIVKPPETVTEINIVINKSADTVTVGTPISWTVNASGGTGTYTYAFYLRKDGKTIIKTPYGTSSAYNYTPSSTGTYAVVAYVKDSNGTIKYKISDTIIVN